MYCEPQKLYHTEGHQIDFNHDTCLKAFRALDISTGDITHETPKETTENQEQTKELRIHLHNLQNSVGIERKLAGLVVLEKFASARNSAIMNVTGGFIIDAQIFIFL